MSSTESGLKKNYLNINMIAKIAVMGALAGALMFFEFPLPFLPPFYKIDFSEVAVLISGFALGPLAAVLVEFIKIVVHLLIKGTTTLFVGELANFLIGCSFVVPAALIYKYHKNKRSSALWHGNRYTINDAVWCFSQCLHTAACLCLGLSDADGRADCDGIRIKRQHHGYLYLCDLCDNTAEPD